MARPKVDRTAISLRLRTARVMQADEGATLTGKSRTEWIEDAIQTAHAALSPDPSPPTRIIRGETEPVIAGAGGPPRSSTKRAGVRPIPKAKGW